MVSPPGDAAPLLPHLLRLEGLCDQFEAARGTGAGPKIEE